MGRAVIDFSCELLRELLFLPDNAEILYSVQPEYPQTIALIVESPDIPDPDPGNPLPNLRPAFRREQSAYTLTMIDWGLDSRQPAKQLPTRDEMLVDW